MGAEYFLFALFVFALAAMLIVLIMRGRSKNKAKEDGEHEERDKKLMMIYFEVEDMIDALKEYVEASRDRIEADIRRIETDMQALSAMRGSMDMMGVRAGGQIDEVVGDADEIPDVIRAGGQGINEPEKSGMVLSAANLVAEGKNIDQIAEELKRSKTEVAFMLKLDAYSKMVDDAQKTMLKKD